MITETESTSTLPHDFCPYKGLQPYTEADRAYFFGRERDREIIISNLYASQLTVFYGASGVGKSSVLLAGVVPILKQTPRLAVTVFRTWQAGFLVALKNETLSAIRKNAGKDIQIPLELSLDEFLLECTKALRGPIFFIFDQFEEYFLYPTTEAESGFEAEFARTVNRREIDVNFLLCMREDGLSKLDRFQGRIPNFLSNMLRLDHLDRKGAIDAIRKPLIEYNKNVTLQLRMQVEDELVEALLKEVNPEKVRFSDVAQGQTQESLSSDNAETRTETPLLQMVLTRLWNEEVAEGSHTMRRDTLTKLGGAKSIANMHLDNVMQQLSDPERVNAASVLRFMVTPAGTKIAQEAGALASWADLPEHSVQDTLLRLSAQDIRILRPLRLIGQPVRYEIFHDVLAAAVLDWRRRYDELVKEELVRHQEQERLHKEQEETARLRQIEESRRLRKSATRLRLVAAGLALVTIVMIFLAFKAYQAKFTARAQVLAAFSTSQLEIDPELSLLLAVEAVKTSQNMRAIEALKTALLESQVSATMGTKKGKRIAAASFSPDGKYVVTGDWGSAVRVWDASNGKPMSSLPGSTGQVNSVSFSADGKYVIAANTDAKVLVWEGWQTSTPTLVKTLIEPKALMTAAFSPNGEFIVTGGGEGKVRVWEWRKYPEDPKPRAELDVASVVASTAPPPTTESGSSKSSQTTSTQPGSDTSPIELEEPSIVQRSPISIYKTAFSPADGDYIVITGQHRRAALVWNWKNDVGKDNPLSLLGHRFAVYDAAFSPDGKYVVTGSDDATAMVWDLKTPQKPLQSLNLGNFRVRGVAFSPNDNGNFVATASYDKFGRLWPWRLGQPGPDKPTQIIVFRGHTGLVMCTAFSPDGRFVVTGSDDGTARVWRTDRVDTGKLYTLSVDELLKLAEARVTRSLTPEERTKYLE